MAKKWVTLGCVEEDIKKEVDQLIGLKRKEKGRYTMNDWIRDVLEAQKSIETKPHIESKEVGGGL